MLVFIIINNGRTGHLFQNRFKSEPIESESYLLTVLRYIHQNPVKARIVQYPKQFAWSSMHEYKSFYNNEDSGIDGDMILYYFSTYESFERYMNEMNNDQCMEYRVIKKYTDNELKNMLSKQNLIKDYSSLSKDTRDKIIKNIYQQTGTSIRQLARVLGIGKTIIERAIKKDK